MSNEKNTMQEATRTSRVPQKVNGFDPMKFARATVNKAGEKVLTLDLAHKKTWFRLACPNGGMVLNPLRVTDAMAIFEARVFADTGDSTPLSSVTAAESADKATGKQYIHTAQDTALSEALDNAGFDIRLYSAAQASGSSRFTFVQPLAEGETVPKSADTGKPAQVPDSTKPATAPKPTAPVQAVQKNSAPVQAAQKAPAPVSAEKRPAPVDPQPRNTAAVKPVQKKDTPPAAETAKQPSASPVVNIATGKPVAAQPQAKEAAHTTEAVKDESAPVSVPDQSAPPAYNADMTVEEICRVMTLEQANAIKVQDGTCKGWTLEQVAKDRPASLKWLLFACPFADNVLKAAAKIVLNDLELKLAG